MADNILADNRRHTTKEDIRQAIQQRTTRGLLTFNTGKVHQLEDALRAVPSTRGGFYQVDLDHELCNCEDFTFFCRDQGLVCRHVYAAAIAREKHRLWLRRAARVIAPIFDPDVEDGETF